MFDYEQILYDALLHPDSNNPLKQDFKNKHLWVKKATGLGITEFMLRLMAWLCTKDDNYRNSQMCIVTGPNIEIATKLIKRLRGIFEPKLGLTFSNKETVLELNGCTIEAYPSNHIDAYRALDNPKFILLDEADFFRKGEQEDVRHVLGHSKLLLEKGYLAINEKFDKLITSLRTAVAAENTLDKEATSYNDVFDSFRLALEYYQARGYPASNDKNKEQEQGSISNSEDMK